MNESDVPEYLKNYSEAQLRIITDPHRQKQVIAAAGSGKTRTVIGVVEHSIKNAREKPEALLLLSFSRRAAAELRQRLFLRCGIKIEVSTFHSFCYRHLNDRHPDFRNEGFQIIEEEEKKSFYFKRLRDCAESIGGIPFELLISNQRFFQSTFPDIFTRLQKEFKAYKKKSKKLEYEDLIETILVDLEKKSDYLFEIRNRYKFIIVDEFQDTDPRQIRFLQLMDPPWLLVVGDDYQCIYSFRQSSLEPFLNLNKYFRGIKRYRLSENYRSLSPIIKLGNKVIRSSRKQIRKRVRSQRGRGPNLPVLSSTLDFGEESDLQEVIASNSEYKILTRSNFRIAIWKQAGIPADNLLTIHKAKGLEFPVVFLDLIGGWNGGARGADRKEMEAQKDEEIRIAYVGLSRAMNLLIVLHKPAYREQEKEGKLWRIFEGQTKEVTLIGLREFLEREKEFRSKSSH